MDVKVLDAAAEWDLEIPEHQRQSRLTLVFGSKNTPAAWFQRAVVRQWSEGGDAAAAEWPSPSPAVRSAGMGQRSMVKLGLAGGAAQQACRRGHSSLTESRSESRCFSCSVMLMSLPTPAVFPDVTPFGQPEGGSTFHFTLPVHDTTSQGEGKIAL